jgi:hypothetical protein
MYIITYGSGYDTIICIEYTNMLKLVGLSCLVYPAASGGVVMTIIFIVTVREFHEELQSILEAVNCLHLERNYWNLSMVK